LILAGVLFMERKRMPSWLRRQAGNLGGGRARHGLIALAAVGTAAALAALLVGWLQMLNGGARVEVYGVAFTLPPHAERLLARISIKNAGSRPALIIGSNNAFILTAKKMTSQEEDSEWGHLGNAEETHLDAPRRLEPGEQWRDYAVVKMLERKEYSAFLGGASLLYVLIRTVYRDASLPASEHRITEACYYYVKDPERPRSCRGHNRRYVAD
jgi:hypothetical protein